MVKINEFERTSNFAWSHDSLPLLASGSAAGAVDMDFSSASTLEIFDIFKTDKEAIVNTALDAKFYGLDWSKPTNTLSRGIIAGALENGVLQLWDALKLLKGSNSDDSTLFKGTKHTGAVKTVQFNPTQENILASAGAKGEIFIWDTNKFTELSAPGKAMTPMEDVTCLSWNLNVKHVFASAGSTGYTSIWDLRAKKEVLHLTYTGTTGRCNLSVVSWNPAESTQLLTASDNDNAPYILSWNLRNPKEPEKILQGHKKGILSLDWCKQDNELLLTCGKDNSTILWDPIHGVKLGEYPTTANWVFETRFAPTLPDVFATASFDGKVVVQSLQDTSPPILDSVAAPQDTNNEDFWGQLASTDTQQPEFVVKKAPKWLKRPTSVSFGFGGKLVHVTQPNPLELKSVITIGKFHGDSKIAEDVKLFSDSIAKKDFNEIVTTKIEKALGSTGKADWELLKDLLTKDKIQLLKEQLIAKEDKVEEKAETDEERPTTKDSEATGDGFFDQLGQELDLLFEPPTGSFELFAKSDTEIDSKLKKLVLAGKFNEAVDACIEQSRLTEALILALNGDDSIKQKVKNAYFTKAIPESTFARVLYSASSNDVTDIVNNADISNWKEIASGISTFANDPQEFNSKISELGDRILSSDLESSRNDALICYAAGGSIDKISSIWLKEVSDFENELLKSDDSITASDAHFKALSQFVEKITVYRAASNITGEFSGPGIEKLCNAILEYANIISNLGEFELADKFLQLLPSSNEQLKIEKDRVLKASGKKQSSSANHQQQQQSFTSGAAPQTTKRPSYVNPATLSNGYTSPAFKAPSLANNPYAAVAATAAATAAPVRAASSNPYAPATALDSIRQGPVNSVATNSFIPQQSQQQQQQQNHVPPPPPSKSAAVNKDVGGWNDLPVHLGVKNARATPSPSPYANVAATAAQQRPDLASRSASFAAAPPLVPPPPPAAAAAVASAAASVSSQASPKTPSLTPRPSKYAPPPSFAPTTEQNGFGSSSQQAAPSPPANPYAPKAQPASNPYAPTPQQPNTNGYAAPSLLQTSVPVPPPSNSNGHGYIPPPPPPTAPSNIAPPAANYNSAPQTSSQPPAPPLAPPKQRYPVGDRSHIPSSATSVFETLTDTLQQTGSKMPEKYHKQVVDTEKRLNILFDHLNNEDLGDDIVNKLVQIAQYIQSGDLTAATSLQAQVSLDHPTECGHWMVGLKRLIQMTEAANR